MAIKIQGSTIIDDSRNIVSAGIATINTKIDVGAGGTIFSADANVSNDNILSVKNTSLNPALDITGIGSVGIGITNPSKSLHVDGTGLLVASGSTTLFSVESFTPNSNVFEVYDREDRIILGVSTSSVGIGSTNIFTITPQVTQTAIGIGTDELITLAPNSGSDNIFQVTNASGSTKHFVVANNGNIGVGTTNPSRKLHVDGDFLVSDGSTEVLEVNGSAGNPLSIQSNSLSPAFDVTGIGSVGIGTTQPSAIFEVVSGGSEVFRISDAPSDNYLEIDTDKFVVNSSGDAGIGTTNPQANLDVWAGAANTTYFRGGTGNPARQLQIRSEGTVTPGAAHIFNAPSVSGTLIFETNNTEVIRINSSQNVGINTNAPTQKLDVNGNVRLRGEIRDANDSPGTPNYVLASGGPGADWSWKVVTDVGAGNLDAVNIKQDGSNVGTGTATEFDFYENFSLTQPSAGIASVRLAENINITGINTVSGNLGIGTDSPQTTLHVVDEFLLSTAGAASSQRITQRAYTTDNGTLSWEGSAGQLFSVTNNLTSGSIFSVNDVSGIPSIDVDADGTIQLAPYGSTEFVGIGTTNPTQKLDVNGNVAIGGSVYDNNDLPGTNGQVLSNVTGFGVSWTDAPTGEVNVNEISSGSYYIGAFETTGTTAQAYIETTNPVVLTSDGNIGIGTTNPQEKLHTIGDVMIQGTGGTGEQTLFIGKSATVLPNSRGVAIAADQNSSAFHDMVLKTSTNSSGLVERLRITSSGNVGIGTTNTSGAADPNNTTILNAGIVTANFYYGDGSGLTNVDTSTLGGISSTSFLRSDAADTKTSGDLTFNDNIRAQFGTVVYQVKNWTSTTILLTQLLQTVTVAYTLLRHRTTNVSISCLTMVLVEQLTILLLMVIVVKLSFITMVIRNLLPNLMVLM